LRVVVAGLLWVAVLSACATSHADLPPDSATHPAVSPARSIAAPPLPARPPSVTAVPPGTVITPGATEAAGEVAGVLPARLPTASNAPPVGTLRELQMNLCNSGEATCYTGGRSIDEASALMRGAARPDMVTLNEVCRRDVTDRLGGVMADLWPYDDIVYLFAPALDAAGGSYRCQNGDTFGNGLLVRVPAGQLTVLDARYGVYADQATDIERRTFGCLRLAPRYTACVTHLENLSPAVALSQCTTLMSGVVPALRRAWGANTPVIVAGDMNLATGVSNCTPADFRQVDDGVAQHVFGSAGIRFPRVDRYPMKQTDHDALLVTVTLP
jgi:endonuclease/exonuclease/phosphatase family metal-dependent hydrolase